jgi:uncharacterized protein (TIGR00156 family)
MSMTHRRIVVTATGLALFATAALAQYTGPGKTEPQALPVLRTVAEVLAKPVDDQEVRIEGALVRKTGRDTYQFRDATGEIQVEIDGDDFPAGQPVGPETRVTVLGEVETRVMRAPEIDVDRLVVSTATAKPVEPARVEPTAVEPASIKP